MIISAIQNKAEPGNIDANIAWHTKLIELAVEYGSNLVFFPELSITGYEPGLGRSLAMTASDSVLDIFQERSDRYDIIIGIGLPLAAGEKVRIGMVWFVPNKLPSAYSKQQLDVDELPFFDSGEEQLILQSGVYRFAPAICYESLQQSTRLRKAEKLLTRQWSRNNEMPHPNSFTELIPKPGAHSTILVYG